MQPTDCQGTSQVSDSALTSATMVATHRLRSRDLTMQEKACYAVLLSYHWETTGQCFPGVETLAGDLGCSRSTVTRLVNSLVTKGVLIRHDRRKENKSNLYEFRGDAHRGTKDHVASMQHGESNHVAPVTRGTPDHVAPVQRAHVAPVQRAHVAPVQREVDTVEIDSVVVAPELPQKTEPDLVLSILAEAGPVRQTARTTERIAGVIDLFPRLNPLEVADRYVAWQLDQQQLLTTWTRGQGKKPMVFSDHVAAFCNQMGMTASRAPINPAVLRGAEQTPERRDADTEPTFEMPDQMPPRVAQWYAGTVTQLYRRDGSHIDVYHRRDGMQIPVNQMTDDDRAEQLSLERAGAR